MCTYLVEEITVVRNYNYGIFKVDKELLKPAYCIHVKVVGRLVKEEDIRVSKERLSKKNLNLFRRLYLAHHHIMILCIYAKSVKKGSRIRFCLPAIHCSEFSLQFTCSYTVFICKVFFSIYGFFFLHYVIKPFISHNYCIKYRICVILKMILLQK